MKTNPDELILFTLQREEDESGVSGTGVVAYGVRWPAPNGRATLAWVAGDVNSVAVYDNLDAIESIHGHGGKTHIVPIYRADMGGPE